MKIAGIGLLVAIVIGLTVPTTTAEAMQLWPGAFIEIAGVTYEVLEMTPDLIRIYIATKQREKMIQDIDDSWGNGCLIFDLEQFLETWGWYDIGD